MNWTLGDPICVAYQGAQDAFFLLVVPLVIALIFSFIVTWAAWAVFRFPFRPALLIAVASAIFGVSGGLLAGVNKGTIIGAAIPAFVTLPIVALTFFLGKEQLRESMAKTLTILVGLGLSVSFGFFYGSATTATWKLLDFDTEIYKKEVEITLRIKEAAELKIIQTGEAASDEIRTLVSNNLSEDHRFGNQTCFSNLRPKVKLPID